jgi:hypothetical protein
MNTASSVMIDTGNDERILIRFLVIVKLFILYDLLCSFSLYAKKVIFKNLRAVAQRIMFVVPYARAKYSTGLDTIFMPVDLAANIRVKSP